MSENQPKCTQLYKIMILVYIFVTLFLIFMTVSSNNQEATPDHNTDVKVVS